MAVSSSALSALATVKLNCTVFVSHWMLPQQKVPPGHGSSPSSPHVGKVEQSFVARALLAAQ